MADITTRAGKGSPLTNNEVDANFTNLNTDKAENGANSDITSLAGITGGVSTADYVDFDTLATGVARATGRLTWNSNDGCLEVGLIGSDVTQQIGQEMVTRVYNADSTTIANGEVVYFWSTAGEVIAGKKYIANATIDPHLIVGLATEDIAAGAYGYVTEFGFVRGLDTAAYNPGDILFASPTTAGAIQSNEPSTPNDVVRVGICLESDSTNGIVLVNPHDVPRSDEIRYDNSDSGLSATNVKAAIDELELVKADIALLTSNVTFYLTSANDAVLTGYKQLVTSTLDTNYDEIAFDYLTGTISNTATMLQAWVSDVNVLVGDIAGIVVPIVGNVRKDTGSGDARFYFEVYIRESDGTETLVTTSNVSDYITSTIYGQISLSATVSLQTFTDTDRVVIKLYGQTDSSTAQYELQLGGTSPFRSLFPVPVSVVPSVANAYAIVADTTNFDGKLSSSDNNVQAALETLDDHVHQASEITGLSASNTSTTTTAFNGHLSAADDDVQKALNTLDEITLDEVAAQNGTTTQNITVNARLDVDNLRLDGNAITSTDTDGNIALTPNGTGEVDISKVDIDGGAIDGTTIGGTTPGAGTFTDLTVNTTATFAGATIADLGTVTTADIDGGTIDGVTLDATIADIDNIRIDGNSITSTDGNGDISITPNGLGEVNISKVDIDAGAIDGTTIGATSAAAGNFTALDVSTSASFSGATIDDLGTVTTADINGGTIDDADITVGAGKTLSVINGTLTLADNQISGDKVHGGIISSFTSTGIDDNATSTAITIDSNENVGIGTINPDTVVEILADDPVLTIRDIDTSTITANATLRLAESKAGNLLDNYWDVKLTPDATAGTALAFTSFSSGEAMRISDSGNVGINETNPNHMVEISGSGGNPRLAFTRTDTNTVGGVGSIQFNALDGHALAGITVLGDGDDEGAHIDFRTTSAATDDNIYNVPFRMRLTSAGDVGIGTEIPSRKFHVNSGTANAVSVFESTDATAYIQLKDTTGSGAVGTTGSGNGLRFWLGDAVTEAMRINSSGNFIFNENGNDSDFRVESSTDTKALYVDGGTGNVSINSGGSFPVEDGALNVNSQDETAPWGNLTISHYGNGYNAGFESSIYMGLRRRDMLNNSQTMGYRTTVETPNASGASYIISAAYSSATSGTGAPDSYIEKVAIKPGEMVVNDPSNNYDFRVESDTSTHMLFVDAGNDAVGIGASVPQAPLQVQKALASDGAIIIARNDRSRASGVKYGLEFRDSTNEANAVIQIEQTGSNNQARMIFQTNNATGGNGIDNGVESLRLFPSENVFNEDSADQNFRVESNSNTHMLFVDAGSNHVNIGTSSDFGGTLNVNGGAVFDDADTFDPDTLATGKIAIGKIADGGVFSAPGIGWGSSSAGNTAAVVATGGNIYFGVGNGSSANNMQTRFLIKPAEVISNEDGLNCDFRVESDANSNALFVDASANTLTLGNEALIHNNVVIRRKEFFIGASAKIRVRITLGNYNYGKLLIMARRSNSGNSIAYWEGFVNNNDNTGYSHAVNTRTSGGTISYTFTNNGDGTYDWDFNQYGSSAQGTVQFYEGVGDATITITTY